MEKKEKEKKQGIESLCPMEIGHNASSGVEVDPLEIHCCRTIP